MLAIDLGIRAGNLRVERVVVAFVFAPVMLLVRVLLVVSAVASLLVVMIVASIATSVMLVVVPSLVIVVAPAHVVGS